MKMIRKKGTTRKIPTEYYVDPSKVTNGCFLVFISTSKKGNLVDIFGIPPQDFHLEIDIYREVRTVHSKETDASGIPLSKSYTICKYHRSRI